MYSVMLAAMLTTTSATPDWGCHGCFGCSGCYGYNAFSCGCWGCSGCYGGCHNCAGCNGLTIGFSIGCHGCHGCSGCRGCYGGCWGCYGGCSGCYGCYGSCYGCCGGCYGCYGGMTYVSSCSCTGTSCTGSSGSGGSGSAQAGAGQQAMEARVRALEEENRALKEQMRRMMQGGKPGKPEEVSVPTPAHVVVTLPEDARLFIDDTACPLTSARREFNTPDLSPGQAYYYDLKAEVTREGRAVTTSKRVTVRAGQETVVDFGEMRALEAVSR